MGEKDEAGVEIEEYRAKIEEKNLPDEARKEAERELDRLSRMHPSSAEYTVASTYLDWITALPWHDRTPDNLDIKKARKILDEDHYGLEKPKKRILEHLAVMKLAGKVAMITGAGGGIGAAVALGLAKEGADVSLIDLTRNGIQETALAIRALGLRAATMIMLHADISRFMAWRGLRASSCSRRFEMLSKRSSVAGPTISCKPRCTRTQPAAWPSIGIARR